MTEGAYLDNDVILKMCAYSAGSVLLDVASLDGIQPSILGVASFSLRSQVKRSKGIADRDSASSQLENILKSLTLLEPSTEEIELAADFERQAVLADLPLDAGESQLLSILLKRSAPLMITGDKRALRALDHIAPAGAEGHLACLEQVIFAAVGRGAAEIIREGICRCRLVDKAVTSSFSCSSASVDVEDICAGLKSYIRAVRRDAARLLITSDDLSAVVPQEHGIGVA